MAKLKSLPSVYFVTHLINHLSTVLIDTLYIATYCILCRQIKGFNSSITTILFEVGSYRTVVG